MDNSGKDSHDLVLSRAFETQIAASEEGAFLDALAYSLMSLCWMRFLLLFSHWMLISVYFHHIFKDEHLTVFCYST